MKMLRAMILSAGRGERLRPLTDNLPKPLLTVAGKTLLEHQIQHLALAGIQEVLVNVSWQAEQIIHFLENRKLPLQVRIQHEPIALNTGGGIAQALPWLCQRQQSFIVTNSDIWHDFPIAELIHNNKPTLTLIPTSQAGDFGVDNGMVSLAETNYTFSGISLLNSTLFAQQSGKFPLTDVLRPAIEKRAIQAVVHKGMWFDVGTHKNLQRVQTTFR